jgi:hypothetical protein
LNEVLVATTAPVFLGAAHWADARAVLETLFDDREPGAA